MSITITGIQLQIFIEQKKDSNSNKKTDKK